MLMRNFGQSFDIRDISGRIADAFAIDGPGVVVDQFFDGGRDDRIAAKRASIPRFRRMCSNRV